MGYRGTNVAEDAREYPVLRVAFALAVAPEIESRRGHPGLRHCILVIMAGTMSGNVYFDRQRTTCATRPRR